VVPERAAPVLASASLGGALVVERQRLDPARNQELRDEPEHRHRDERQKTQCTASKSALRV
jgi:hypothetical protein